MITLGTCVNAPLAEQAALWETTGPNDLPDYMQLCHMIYFDLRNYQEYSVRRHILTTTCNFNFKPIFLFFFSKMKNSSIYGIIRKQ